MATIMLAREEWRLDGPRAAPFVRRAVEMARGDHDVLLELCLQLLEAEVESSASVPT
jgi:hypothetical protein